MPSYKKIKIDSPRVGIMISSKNIEEEDKAKDDKIIKIDIIQSKKTYSIHDHDSVSLENHQHATHKDQIVTLKSIAEPPKKSCLKNADASGLTGLSLKKIAIGQDDGILDCKSARSTRSIKFNKKTSVYIYKKDGENAEQRAKRLNTLRKMMKQNQNQVEASEEDQCCVIF